MLSTSEATVHRLY